MKQANIAYKKQCPYFHCSFYLGIKSLERPLSDFIVKFRKL